MERALLVLLALAVIAGCATTRTQESSGEYVDSSVLSRERFVSLDLPELHAFAHARFDLLIGTGAGPVTAPVSSGALLLAPSRMVAMEGGMIDRPEPQPDATARMASR